MQPHVCMYICINSLLLLCFITAVVNCLVVNFYNCLLSYAGCDGRSLFIAPFTTYFLALAAYLLKHMQHCNLTFAGMLAINSFFFICAFNAFPAFIYCCVFIWRFF